MLVTEGGDVPSSIVIGIEDGKGFAWRNWDAPGSVSALLGANVLAIVEDGQEKRGSVGAGVLAVAELALQKNEVGLVHVLSAEAGGPAWTEVSTYAWSRSED